MRLDARVRLDVDLEADDEIRGDSWWYEQKDLGRVVTIAAHGVGMVAVGGFTLTSKSPAVLRALAATAAAAADELEQRYAEHGIEPPAAGPEVVAR